MPWLDRRGTVEQGNVRGSKVWGETYAVYGASGASLVAGGQVVGLVGHGQGEACLDTHKRPCYSFFAAVPCQGTYNRGETALQRTGAGGRVGEGNE